MTEIERLVELLKDINSRDRHLHAGAWEVRLYQDDFNRIDDAIKRNSGDKHEEHRRVRSS